MRALSTLIKPASGLCNMRCKYCFYADITDLREVKSYGVMRPETLETIVRRALEEAEEMCAFGFQGGEPTLAGLDFFRHLIELEEKYNTRGVRISHSLQTNGMLIDNEWALFLSQNHFLTGLSIDGPKAVHDELRPDTAGKGTHNRCMAAARLLRRHGAEFNILTVLTRQLAAHPDKTYNFMKQQGFGFLQFIPCIDGLDEGHGSNRYSLDAAVYGKFLCRIFDLWYSDFVQDKYISIRAFDNYIHMLAGHPPESCAMAGVCSPYALIEADGSVYPCDFYALDEYRLGNVADNSFGELLTGEAAMRFSAASRTLHPDCKECRFFPICRGGCRRDREPFTDAKPRLNPYCAAYQMFFAHALPRMQEVAARVFR